LDMRMDRSQKKTAHDVVNQYAEDDLAAILRDYGEERYSKLIARKIAETRRKQPIHTTYELVDVIRSALPEKELRKKGHPAKQTFQALRIEVNDELNTLQKGLSDSLTMLKIGGRCAVITFHSLEDRIVKKIFKDMSTAPFVDPRLPLKETQMEQASFSLVNKKVIVAAEEEQQTNHRSHSAKLRVIERIR
ncbi:MAG: 16S rRNA (cytosine(1402)-N(4))-methyltransferase RsmH, partial [Solobacterium sp.]|nr:16S rRNA (cytosine(1402)-N(4))-methyltransferase RsmH [Solobacterium sp.]